MTHSSPDYHHPTCEQGQSDSSTLEEQAGIQRSKPCVRPPLPPLTQERHRGALGPRIQSPTQERHRGTLEPQVWSPTQERHRGAPEPLVQPWGKCSLQVRAPSPGIWPGR